jgi:hypothetical protein
MRKKRSITKSRAASLKAHRTIARMKEARQVLSLLEMDRLLTDSSFEQDKQYHRVLPNPWLDMK